MESTRASTPPTGRVDRSRLPEASETTQRVPWSVLGPHMLREWGYPRRPGGRRKREPQHLEVLGQTGSGKSYFILYLLQQRATARGSHVVVLATKPDDGTLTATGWPIIESWPPEYGKHWVIYWPQSKGISREGRAQQREKVLELLNKLWKKNSNIIIYFDEIAYISKDLGLMVETEKYYRESRALGITIVAATQRPQGVTRYMHSESAWTVCFAPKDEEDAERMAQVLGGKRTYMPILQTLDRSNYEFLIVENSTGKRYISWIDRPLPRRKPRKEPEAAER